MTLPRPIQLPNPRELFIPTPGYIFVEPDLAGADARVASWECGGQFKADFNSGIKIHQETQKWFAKVFMPELTKVTTLKDDQGNILREGYPKVEPWYTRHKNWAFGSTYGGGPPTVAAESGTPVQYVKAFQPWWFGKYPTIKDWHKRVENSLSMTRSVSNAFGYSIRYFDRIEGLLPEALAWIPQSTVAIACMRGGLQVKERISWARPILQNHDAFLYEIPRQRWNDLPLLREAFQVTVPYPDPLLMKADFKASAKSWGHCSSVNWDTMELPEAA